MKNFNMKPLGLVISSLVFAAATQAVYAQEAEKKTDSDVE